MWKYIIIEKIKNKILGFFNQGILYIFSYIVLTLSILILFFNLLIKYKLYKESALTIILS